jgi:hypothetical protein
MPEGVHMLHLHNQETMAIALTGGLDPKLRRLLTDRIAALAEDLIDWTEYLVIEPADTEADIIRHIGFTPLVEPIDGKRFGEPGFHEYWDWLVDHDGWFELSVSFGSTFAYVLFIEEADRVPTDLLTLCRRYSKP